MVIFSENKQSEVCSDQNSFCSKCIQENFRPSNTQSWQQLFSVRISSDLQTQITKDKICQPYKTKKTPNKLFSEWKSCRNGVSVRRCAIRASHRSVPAWTRLCRGPQPQEGDTGPEGWSVEEKMFLKRWVLELVLIGLRRENRGFCRSSRRLRRFWPRRFSAWKWLANGKIAKSQRDTGACLDCFLCI